MSTAGSPGRSLLEDVVKRRKNVADAQSSLFWGLLNSLCLILLSLELYQGLFWSRIKSPVFSSILWGCELVCLFIFSLNTLYDVLYYLWPYLWMKPIELTVEEKRLLGIRENEVGFKTSVRKNEEQALGRTPLPKFSPSPKFSISPSNSASQPRPSQSQSQSPSQSPLNMSNVSSIYSSTPSPILYTSSPNLSQNTSSWMYQQNTSGLGLGTSHVSDTRDDSPAAASFLRKRYLGQTSTTGDVIKDDKSLQSYLKSFQVMEDRLEQMTDSQQNKQGNAADSWNFVPVTGSVRFQEQSDLNKLTYQPANDSLIIPNDDEVNKESGTSPARSRDSLTSRLEVSECGLNAWVENIRTWISGTILDRLVDAIGQVNESLSKMGFTESLIGEIGLSALKQLVSLKSKEIPTLAMILPYLEISVHQEYLVKRIKDLAKGGCISDFSWDGGASHKGKHWSEDLPTDSAIIINAFCVYMDSRMPSATNCPDGKAFTSQFFAAVGQQPTNKSTAHSFYVQQTKVNPPHYNVVLKKDEEEVWEIPNGRNNLFYALLAFLHFVGSKNHGLLGRTNLGPSGVNVLWVIGR